VKVIDAEDLFLPRLGRPASRVGATVPLILKQGVEVLCREPISQKNSVPLLYCSSPGVLLALKEITTCPGLLAKRDVRILQATLLLICLLALPTFRTKPAPKQPPELVLVLGKTTLRAGLHLPMIAAWLYFKERMGYVNCADIQAEPIQNQILLFAVSTTNGT